VAKHGSPRERDPVDLAARALQHRDRSRRELDDRLSRAGVGDEERADALARLERVGYVDDARFAAARAEALAGRGYGDAAIRHDLEAHGIDAEGVQVAIGVLDPERERARALVERLGRSMRTARQLARKGFGEESLEAAVGADVAEGAA
jgi:regulatory protein